MPKVPAVPDPLPEPLTTFWPARTPILRCYSSDYGATEFNPKPGLARLRPVMDGGLVVPTVYGSDMEVGTLSETIFRAVPVRGPHKTFRESGVTHKLLTTITCDRDLRLIKLTGNGLTRLGVTHPELIESSPDQYQRTADWAQALYDEVPDADGLLWRSRQNNDARVIMLWGTRVERATMTSHGAPPLVLAYGSGLDLVRRVATEAGITLI